MTQIALIARFLNVAGVRNNALYIKVVHSFDLRAKYQQFSYLAISTAISI